MPRRRATAYHMMSIEFTADVQGAVRALIARLLALGTTAPDLAARLGMEEVNAVEAFSALGLPGTRWPMSRCIELWRLAEQALQDPAIGLTLAHHDRAHPRHLLVYLAQSSSTLHDALLECCRHASLLGDAVRLQLRVEGKVARLFYANLDWRLDAHWHDEYMLSMLAVMLSRITESRLNLQSVSLSTPAPSYAAQFATVFRAPVTFAAGQHALAFDAVHLTRSVASADTYLHRLLLSQTQAMHETVEDALPLTLRVQRTIVALLVDGREANAASVAQEMGTTLRRLRQRLDASGANFRDLLEDVRRNGAARYLRSGWGISRVAAELGFSESSALHHAFKRWHGQSVGEYLQSLHDAEPPKAPASGDKMADPEQAHS